MIRKLIVVTSGIKILLGFFFFRKNKEKSFSFYKTPETYHTTNLLLKHGDIDQLSFPIHPLIQRMPPLLLLEIVDEELVHVPAGSGTGIS